MKNEIIEDVRDFCFEEFNRTYNTAFYNGATVTLKSIRHTFETCNDELPPNYIWTMDDIRKVLSGSEDMILEAHKRSAEKEKDDKISKQF